MSAPAKPWEVDTRERSLLIQAALLVGRDIIFEALAEFPDPSETNPARESWAGSSRTPAFANAAGSAAPHNGTAAATVMGIKYKQRECLPKQSTTRATTSLFHNTFLTILLFHPSTAQFLSFLFLSRVAWQHPGASALMVKRRRCTSTCMWSTDHPQGFELM